MAKQEINFRATDGYRGDDSADAFVMTSSNLVYPNATPQGFTVGWTDSGSLGTGDRSLSVDARLAGAHFLAFNAPTRIFRVTLPAAGTYDIRLALGYPSFTHYGKVDMYDGASFVTTLADKSGQTGGNWADATDTAYSGADWPGSNSAYRHTFTSTDVYFHLENNGAVVGNRFLAHIALESVGGGAAELAGDATAAANAAGDITTEIPLNGASIVVATATGALNAPITLSADASAIAAATASLTTKIQLAGNSVGNADATGGLDTGITLGGDAAGQSTAAADMTATITLSGAAVAQALANAGIDTSILLSGNAGGQADATGDLGGGASQLQGAATSTATATGALTIQIQLAADAVAQSLAAGSLDAPVNLEGGVSGNAAATGELSTQIQVDADAQTIATATGALASTAVPLAGDAVAIATAAGDLNTEIKLEGAALNVVSATGSLTVSLEISGNAAALVVAGADLTTNIPLNAAAIGRVLAAGNLSGGVSTIAQNPNYTTKGLWRNYRVAA
ncbi:hypothetical protein SAMN05216302_102117 [Nitrosomonas aestuarii]|uniref:Uncharacterized protein n=1 Tax=Nitrosomonas aestuarii TaxID=52441 RepID=A0A1I4DEV2_9PROT|nr:hypothetical protein [Nitrosomonas aestuarii]SFK92158.1 hypothetical protein SAMN05216302_102117 [Nitrosomonas aestuarii]